MIFDKLYRADIQALRGLSVLAVVLFHTNKDRFYLGYLGVDVFFVISGFVVTPLILRIFIKFPNLEQDKYRLKDFLIARFFRLAPALTSTILFSGLIIFLLDPFLNQQNFARQGISAIFLLANFSAYKYSGDYFSNDQNPLIHTWSLSVEEQIYFLILVLFTMIFPKRNGSINRAFLCFLIITVTSFISFLFPWMLKSIYSELGIESHTQISFYSPLDRIWQFTLGGLVFIFVNRSRLKLRKKKNLNLLNVFIVSTLFLTLFSSFSINQKTSSIVASSLAVLSLAFKSLEIFPKLLFRLFEWLGDRSYSIYLVHMPIIYIVNKLFERFDIRSDQMVLQNICSIILTVIIGTLSYSKVENKFRNINNRQKNSIRHYVISIFFAYLIPLALLFPVGLQPNNNMYKDRLDNGICKFWTPILDANFYTRFNACNLEYGKATIILGDSHALNIYNTMFLTNRHDFLVGISKGGCRPSKPFDYCPYIDFEKFVSQSSEKILQVFFHQSGSYLLSDINGKVDSDLAFRGKDSFNIVTKDLNFLFYYLSRMGQRVPTVWIGPFPEARINSTLPEVWANKIKVNLVVKTAFKKLEEEIKLIIKQPERNFDYISLLEILGPLQYEVRHGNCLMFRDKDHWSICAERKYSRVFNTKGVY
jgi:peptidoglycan/LPS O-acetylase OafA/YrhL